VAFGEGTSKRESERLRRARKRAGVKPKPKSNQAREFGAATGTFVPTTLKPAAPIRNPDPDKATTAKKKFTLIATAAQRHQAQETKAARTARERARAADLAAVSHTERVRLLDRATPLEMKARTQVQPGRRSEYQKTQDYLAERDTLIGRGASQVGRAGRAAPKVVAGIGLYAGDALLRSAREKPTARGGLLGATGSAGGGRARGVGLGAKAFTEQLALGPDASAYLMGGRHGSKIGLAFDTAMAGLSVATAGGAGGAAAAFGGFRGAARSGAGRAGRDFLGAEKAISKAAKKKGRAPKVHEVDVSDDYLMENVSQRETLDRTAIVYNRRTGNMLVQGGDPNTGRGVWHSGLVKAWEDETGEVFAGPGRYGRSNPLPNPAGRDPHEVISISYFPPKKWPTHDTLGRKIAAAPGKDYPGGIEIYAPVDRIPPMLIRNLRKRYPGIPILGYEEQHGRLIGLPHLKGAAQKNAQPFPAWAQWGDDPSSAQLVSKQDLPPSRDALFAPEPQNIAPGPLPTANDLYDEAWRRPSAPIENPAHLHALLDDVGDKRVTPSEFNRQLDASPMSDEELAEAIQEYANDWIVNFTTKVDAGDVSPEEVQQWLSHPLIPQHIRVELNNYWIRKQLERPSQAGANNQHLMDLIDQGMLTREDLHRQMDLVGYGPSQKEALDDYFTQVNEPNPHDLDDLRGYPGSDAVGRKLTDEADDVEQMQWNAMLDRYKLEIQGGLTRSQLERKMEEDGLDEMTKVYLRQDMDEFEATRRKDPEDRILDDIRGTPPEMGKLTPSQIKEVQDDLGLTDEEMEGIVDDYEYMMGDDELREIVLGEGAGKTPSGEKSPATAAGGGGDEPPDKPPVAWGGWEDDFPEYIDWSDALTDGMTPDEVVRARRTNKILEFLNIPRTLKSTLDWSHPLRQSIVMLGAFPKEWQQAWGPMIKAARDPAAAEAMWKRMQDMPQYHHAKRYGVRYNDLGDDITLREEPLQGLRYVNKIWGVSGSARAYTTFGNVASQAAWDNMIRLARKKGYNVAGTTKESKKMLEDIAKFVNISNGRGNIKGMGNSLSAINALFFSPRLIHSRLQLLNPLPGGYYGIKGTNIQGMHPLVRRRALTGAAALAGEIAVVSAMAWQAGEMLGEKVQTEINPLSSDFGKVRVGDTRIDLSGGIAAYVTLASRLGSQRTKTQHDQVEDLGPGLGMRSGWEVFVDFFENKLSPVAATGVDYWLKKERGIGEPLTQEVGGIEAPWMLPVDLMAPINLANVAEQRNNLPIAATTLGLGSVGLGVDTYTTESEPKLNAKESLDKKIKEALQEELPLAKKRGWSNVPPHIKKAITLREKVEARLQSFEKTLKSQDDVQVPKGEQLKLRPKQRYMAVINALRDYEPRFNYKNYVAKADQLTEKGLEYEQGRLRRIFYGKTLEKWHGGS
jgi:hypothetical protein